MDIMKNGDWFLTYTGRQFWPVDPSPEDICIEDIAHALSQTCRFGGHCRQFYSVAQHAVLVSLICPNAPFQGLMHDATEAYCGDMVRPLKSSQPQYQAVEERIWEAVCERFGIEKMMHPEVKRADNVLLMTEKRDLLIHAGPSWGKGLETLYPPLNETITPLVPIEAEALFLKRFKQL